MSLSPLMMGSIATAAVAAAAAAFLLTRKKPVAAAPASMPVASTYRAPAPKPLAIPLFPQAEVLRSVTAKSPWLRASTMSWVSDNAPDPTPPSAPASSDSGDPGFSFNADGSASLDEGLSGDASFSFSGDPVVARHLHRRRLLRRSGL